MDNQYSKFLNVIFSLNVNKNFGTLCEQIASFVNSLKKTDIIELLKDIGNIPERIEASSTQEKLYSKASDIILARCFRELGLKSKAIDERGNSADIVSESLHGYTLVADAKTFRLSRTAKNQKDFKISALSKWRGMENDYAVLVAPYF